MKGMLFDIQRASTVDGPGFRTTVFFKGCNLRCAWCHNPESQSAAPQLLFYQERCTHCGLCERVCPYGLRKCDLCGKCADACPQEARSLCGTEYTVEDVVKKILPDRLFYQTSGGGATFSGGECMLQLGFLKELLDFCRKEKIHTAVDTAGTMPWRSFEEILPYTDMFLYDVKSMNSQRHKEYTGIGNEQILENLSRLLQMQKRVWVRVPIIPGVNDTLEEMRALRAFLLANGYPEKVELLPYHRMGEMKWKALGQKATLFNPPSAEQVDTLRNAVKP